MKQDGKAMGQRNKISSLAAEVYGLPRNGGKFARPGFSAGTPDK